MKLAHGIHAMLVTPFTAGYQLNEEASRKEVRWALDNGANGIVATPSIDEFLHLSEAERTRAFEVTLQEIRKRPGGVPATAMTSDAATLETLHYARIAATMGYDAQRVIAPYYWRCGEEALGHLGTIKVTASVATGIDMGPARPPYMAPADAVERLRKRLPQLREIL